MMPVRGELDAISGIASSPSISGIARSSRTTSGCSSAIMRAPSSPFSASPTTGAADVDPAQYGEARHPRTVPMSGGRDRFELALVRAALEAGLPVLGICRGMQVLNVACGGTLEQHLPDVLGHESNVGPPGRFVDHEVRLEDGSLAARAVGGERTAVKSYHHQGVRTLGDGLSASGFSALDDVVEAIE